MARGVWRCNCLMRVDQNNSEEFRQSIFASSRYYRYMDMKLFTCPPIYTSVVSIQRPHSSEICAHATSLDFRTYVMQPKQLTSTLRPATKCLDVHVSIPSQPYQVVVGPIQTAHGNCLVFLEWRYRLWQGALHVVQTLREDTGTELLRRATAVKPHTSHGMMWLVDRNTLIEVMIGTKQVLAQKQRSNALLHICTEPQRNSQRKCLVYQSAV
jgi:hypothetical protein